MDPESGEEEPSVELAGEIRHQTEKAWLFFDGFNEYWLPKSRCKWDPDEKVMIVPEWLAIADGLV